MQELLSGTSRQLAQPFVLHGPHHNDVRVVPGGKFANTRDRRTFNEMATRRWHPVALG